ncbi:MAG: zf-HC2 domain-containing protein [Acidimicrobiia bacterium]|nr:zf-HC2 domain-containing protein [Acidimicrobiia bacterium]
MNTLGCDDVRELAPELALGNLPGPERAAVLRHLEHCADCQRLVEELADAADALLLLAPEVEPPTGFEARVLAGFDVPVTRRRRLGVAVAAIAAALVLVIGLGAAMVVSHGGGRSSSSQFAITDPGVVTARFTPAPGEHTQGQLFSYAGKPSWVFMTVRDDGSSDTYRCQLELADGQRVEVGSFGLHDGTGSWGRTVAIDVHQLRAVRLLDEHGATAATATLA